jgi:hypothetical protein
VTAIQPGDRVVGGVYQALPDPIDDMLLSLVTQLAAEVWTVRDRLRLVESALARHGIPVDALVEDLRNGEEAVAAMRVDRDDFVARVFAVMAPNGAPPA